MPLPQSAIETDAPDTNKGLDLDDGVNEFLKRLMPTDAEKPPGSKEATKQVAKEESAETAPEEKPEAAAEKPEAEAETEEAEGETTEPPDKSFADEGAYVKVKVGDEEHEVPVKDLQRLFGQEKALTQKSMEVAEQRKKVDAELATNAAATNALLTRAKARYEPYSKIDFLLAAKDLSAEDYTNLRTAAQAAYEDVQFLEKNLNGFMQAAQQRQHETLVTQAKEALKVLTGPTDAGGIEGWNEKYYDDIRTFAVNEGLGQQIINNLVDPAAIRILNKAMLYERSQGKSKVVTTKVNKTPTKVVKTTRAPEAGAPGDKTDVKAALKKLSKSGSTDDAANAFMAGWASNDANQ